MYETYNQWIPDILRLAKATASHILALRQENLKIFTKPDGSPLTNADVYAHNKIKAGLCALSPDIPIISEEDEPVLQQVPAHYKRYWLVDPIDGTREFIQGSSEFTINIALVEEGKPVLGLIFVPELDQGYWASLGRAYFQANNASPEQILVNQKPHIPLKVAISRSASAKKLPKFTQILDSLGDYELIACGSSLKICLVASGQRDLYPCFGRTYLWDTAAGQCIVEAAGGQCVDFAGKPLSYASLAPLQNPPFLVTPYVELLSQIVDKWAHNEDD